jgi:hypothetical protein
MKIPVNNFLGRREMMRRKLSILWILISRKCITQASPEPLEGNPTRIYELALPPNMMLPDIILD